MRNKNRKITPGTKIKYVGRKQLIGAYILAILLVVNVVFLLKTQTEIDNIHQSLAKVVNVLSTEREEPQTKDIISDRLPDNYVQASSLDYPSLCVLPKVDKPVRRSRGEALAKLEELAKDSQIIDNIYRNRSDYSDDMLEALANNPEMADFVAGYLKADAKQGKVELTEAEKTQNYPLFLQWDPRWGYEEYGDDSNIGLAGCGPTCISMAMYYLLGDETLTPDTIAAYGMKNGYYVAGTGTAWSLLSDVPGLHGLSVSEPEIAEKTMKRALDKGGILICSMRPGDFTAGGHFVVIYGYDDKGFLINDPNCVARSREHWSYEKIGKQIKHLWCYSI